VASGGGKQTAAGSRDGSPTETEDGLSEDSGSTNGRSGHALVREMMAVAAAQAPGTAAPSSSSSHLGGGGGGTHYGNRTTRLQIDSFNMVWASEDPRAAIPTKETHCVDEPPADLFRVRGPNYLTDRLKYPAQFHAMRLLGVDLIRSDHLIQNVCEGMGKAKMEHLQKSHGDDIFLVNFQLPGKPGHLSLLLWFGLTQEGRNDPKFYPLWQLFKGAEEDEYRNMRLKLMVIIPDGPFLLRKAVPGNKPVILGKGIRIDWYRGGGGGGGGGGESSGGGGYLEANINISSSSSAEKMWGLVQAVAKSIVVDLALIIESKEAHQLPEVLFGAVRMMKVRLDEV